MIFSTFSFSQQNAEELFKDYFKLDVVFSSNIRKAENDVNPLNYKWGDYKEKYIGLEYNFYQYQNYNFLIGAQFGMFGSLNEYIQLDDDEVNSSIRAFEVSTGESEGNIAFYLMAERLYPIKRTYLGIALGLEVFNNPYIYATSTSSFTSNEGERIEFFNIKYDSAASWMLGAKARLSCSLPTNMGMFKVGLDGHLGFSNFLEGKAEIKNLLSSPDMVSNHSIKNNYIGFSIAYFLKKSK